MKFKDFGPYIWVALIAFFGGVAVQGCREKPCEINMTTVGDKVVFSFPEIKDGIAGVVVQLQACQVEKKVTDEGEVE